MIKLVNVRNIIFKMMILYVKLVITAVILVPQQRLVLLAMQQLISEKPILMAYVNVNRDTTMMARTEYV